MLTRVIVIGAAVALLGSPALAGDKKNKDPGQRVVCLDMQAVGSHIPDRICKTQAEWDQEKNDAKYDIDHLGGKPNSSTGGHAPGQSSMPGGPH